MLGGTSTRVWGILMIRRASTLAAALAIASATARAQNEPLRQPASIPIDLATALTKSGGFGGTADPQILIGEMPGWITSRLPTPKGSTVLGSAFIGTQVLAIFDLPSDSVSALKPFEEELQRVGWKPPTVQRQPGGGFQNLPTAPSTTRLVLCLDRQCVTGSVVRRRGGVSTIALRITDVPTVT